MHPKNCPNCNAHLEHEFAFCPQCGQSTHLHPISLAHVGHEAIHFMTHADKGIFFLIKSLLSKTGEVAREYIDGKRKVYFPPLNFFLIAVGIFVFVQTTFHPTSAVSLDGVRAGIRNDRKLTEETKVRRLAKTDRAEKATNFMAKNSNIINFVLTPVFTLVFFLAYYKQRFNYTEHLVANFYIAGIGALFFAFIIAPLLVLARGSQYYFAVLGIFLLFEIVYRTVFYYRFIGSKGAGYVLKPLLLSVFIIAAWSFLSRFFIARYIETGNFL